MSFDRLAPHYRWLEFALAGGRLQRCRLAWLKEVRDCREVLLVGEGPGRFLEVCARELPQARIVCVDASRPMLARAEAAWQRIRPEFAQAEFIQGVLPEWQPPAATFDLIVTHFFLDCFPEPMLARIVTSLAAAAKREARWLLADFQIPDSGTARIRALCALMLAYWFFRFTARLPARRLVSPDAALCAQGFHPIGRRTYDWGLLRSELWSRDWRFITSDAR